MHKKSKRLGLGDDIFKSVSKSLIKITFREEEQDEEANVGFGKSRSTSIPSLGM